MYQSLKAVTSVRRELNRNGKISCGVFCLTWFVSKENTVRETYSQQSGRLIMQLHFFTKRTSSTVQKECDGTCIVLTHAYYTPGYCQKPSTIYMSYNYTNKIAQAYGLTFSRACSYRLCYLMLSSLCVLPQYIRVLLHMVLDTRDSYSCQSQFYFSRRRSLRFFVVSVSDI